MPLHTSSSSILEHQEISLRWATWRLQMYVSLRSTMVRSIGSSVVVDKVL